MDSFYIASSMDDSQNRNNWAIILLLGSDISYITNIFTICVLHFKFVSKGLRNYIQLIQKRLSFANLKP